MTIINSLLDNDLYKYTMQQAVLHQFPDAQAEYQFVLRSKDVDLTPYKDKIDEEISHLCRQTLQEDELDYLRSLPFIKSDFVDFLEDFTLKPRTIITSVKDGKFDLRIKGSWLHTILLEVPLMAIISEVYLQDKISKEEAFKTGQDKFDVKKDILNKMFPDVSANFADFGTRRRYSREWHERVVGEAINNFGTGETSSHFVGTSNILLAKKYGLKPIGTMAHEWIQAGQGLEKVQLKNSQSYMLETWVKEYRGDLGIALTDTIGYKSFLKDFDKYFSKLYDGVRHDSADPIVWGERMIDHYKKLGIDPITKTAVFSDSLDFNKMIDIAEHFKGRIKTSFGIGTNLTNDVGVKPLSMVIKLVRMNDNPVAKISDEPSKAICEDSEFLNYLMKVYNVKNLH